MIRFRVYKIIYVGTRAVEIIVWFGRARALASNTENSPWLTVYISSVDPCKQVGVGKWGPRRVFSYNWVKKSIKNRSPVGGLATGFYPPVRRSTVRAMAQGDNVVFCDVPTFTGLRCTRSTPSRSSWDGTVYGWSRLNFRETMLYSGGADLQRSDDAVFGRHRPDIRGAALYLGSVVL